MAIANLYTVDALKLLCQTELRKYVDADNVVVLLQQSMLLQAELLRSACLKFLLSHFAKKGDKEAIQGYDDLEEEVRDEIEDMQKLRAVPTTTTTTTTTESDPMSILKDFGF